MGESTARSGARQWSRTGWATADTEVRGYRGELARRRSLGATPERPAGRSYSRRSYSATVSCAIAGQAKCSIARAGGPPGPSPPARAGSASSAFTRSAKSAAKRCRVARRAGAVVAGLDRHEQAGHAVVDDLEDAAGRRRHDGGLAGHRLEVDDPQRLVDRRADEHRGVAEELDHLAAWAASRSSQTTPLALGLQLARRGARPRRRSPACRARRRRARAGPPGRTCGAASSRCATPFWRVIRPTNTTDGRAGSIAVALEHVGARVGRVLARCRCRCRSRARAPGSIAG